MNWRKQVIYLFLYLSRSGIPARLKQIRAIERLPAAEKEKIQQEKLKKLLLHAYKNVPYYKGVLLNAGVIRAGAVDLHNFNRIPLLTKDIIREQGSNLYSVDYKRRKPYANTSGGSTGEPVRFIQDKEYDEWNTAAKIYFNEKLGKVPGEPEIKLWGSERDIIEGNLTLKDRLMNRLYNRVFHNSYVFDKNSMLRLAGLNNKIKPKSYWAYVDAAYMFSKFVLENNIKLNPPEYIVTSIGPLYPEQKRIIEKAFGCRAYNQYGSREVGAVASQDRAQNELKVFFWRQFLEILTGSRDGNKNERRIIVTTLDNYSMPLIRYQIGDVAESGEESYRIGQTVSYLSIKNVIGRTLGFFKKKDGTLIHTHFMVQQTFFKDWIKKIQIVQKDYDLVVCNIAVEGGQNRDDIDDISGRIKTVMGQDCRVEFRFVSDIKPSRSGKYLYTVSEI